MVDSHAGQFFGDASDKPEGNEWYIKAGLRQHCLPLGHTVWYGEYGQNNDRMNSQVFLSGVTNTQERQWGLGVVQEIDAAAMSVWLGWRHYTADATCNRKHRHSCLNTLNFGHNDLDNMDIIKSGALINF